MIIIYESFINILINIITIYIITKIIFRLFLITSINKFILSSNIIFIYIIIISIIIIINIIINNIIIIIITIIIIIIMKDNKSSINIIDMIS